MTISQLMPSRTVLRSAMRWVVTIVVLVVVIGGGWLAYQRLTVPQVTLSEVVEGPVVQAFYATGTLLPYREYPIKANVEGTLVDVFVDKGDEVKKGQKVARVLVEEFLLKRSQADAELELKKQLADHKTSPTLLEYNAKIRAADQQYTIAKREFDRLSQLRDTAGRTLTEIEKAQDAMQTYKNNAEALTAAKAAEELKLQRDLKTAQAEFEIAQWNIDQQMLTSPIDGVVLDWPAAVGTRAKANDLIMHIGNVKYDELVMRTNVDEEDKTRVRIDQIVHITLYSYPDQIFTGRVKEVYPKADPARRTFEVDVQMLEPRGSFSAGMTGELAFVVDHKEKAVVVPSQAVQNGQVWTVQNHRLQPLDVKVGLRSIQRTEILAGLEPGQEIVISPLGHLQPGATVRTIKVDPQAAAGLNEPKKEQSSFQGMGR